MSKPKFDSTKPFEVVNKPRFDPSKSFQEAPEVGQTESALRGAAQGASFGFADEITGAGEAGLDTLTGKNKDLSVKEAYQKHRDESRAAYKAAEETNPKSYFAGEMAGAVAPALLPGGQASALGRLARGGTTLAEITGMGALRGLGSSDSDLTEGEVGRAAIDTAIGAVGSAAGYGLGKGISKGVEKAQTAKNRVAEYLKEKAEKSALAATGATGNQASQFADNAGRELLDRGIVKFGRSPEGIAKAAQEAVEGANKNIDTALTALDAQGVKVPTDKLVGELDKKINLLRKDPSKSDIVRKLENEIVNIKKGELDPLLSAAEATKRGYNSKAGNWTDPESARAGKEMYQLYRNEVENAAQSADPELAKLFKEGKETYGLLNPIQEAAAKRAYTSNQSPVGGLLDMASIGAGGAVGGPSGVLAATAPIARRVVAPRVNSSIAVTMDGVSKLLQTSPERLGRFQGALSKAASRGKEALAATVSFLSGDPEFKKMMGIEKQRYRAMPAH